MKLIFLLFFIHFVYSAPPEQDERTLWKNLFSRLDTVLARTEELSRNLKEVNRRQKDLESRMTKLQDSLNETQMNFSGNYTQTALAVKLKQSWTPILRRQDASVDFNRPWLDYKLGFGNPDASFFIGLERLHKMTSHVGPQELLVVMTDFQNRTRFANYDVLRIGNETENYAIKELGEYFGDAGDGLGYHKNKEFSTYDRNNNAGKIKDCPHHFQAGWWYHDPCYKSNLHGPYRSELNSQNPGVSWDPWMHYSADTWRWDQSLKYATMMIRSKL
ncbi:ficolin-1-A-like [Musca autumnalis]|uniref:ficolin-1-A-like n=1 Tax=Musca autumnalis TaxID=221902 RepID=UPI003CF69999